MMMIKDLLSNTRFVLLGAAFLSAAALGMAFMAEYMFGLKPCILCLYQRVPFAAVVLFGILGFLSSYKCQIGVRMMLGLSGIAMLGNSMLAFYHTGVEQKWWPSFLEGCAVPKLEGDIDAIMDQIAAAPVVRCDEIPWQDPILGLSMANYNILFCLGLAVLCFAALALAKGQACSKSPSHP